MRACTSGRMHVYHTYPELGECSNKRHCRFVHCIKQDVLLHVLVLFQDLCHLVHHSASIVPHTKLNTPPTLVCTLNVVGVRTEFLMLLLQVTFISAL